ncbi:MAG: prepilin-type N-terminal cleavage/methylation domain-containing protein [Pseudomonadota bacterium]
MLVIPRTPRNTTQGFTLLEILLVLVIVGLAGTVVVPRVSVIYDNLVLRSEREALLRDIRALPLQARAAGRSVVAASDDSASSLGHIIDVPEHWAVEFSESLRYQANGFCTGGAVLLLHDSGAVWRYGLAAPYCEPVQIADVDQVDS